MNRLLIANRGEIAIRIARAAADMGLPTVAVHSEDDASSLHLRVADEAQLLPGQGAAAYLDMATVIAAAKASGCDAIHPGYGFLAERGDFASACAEGGPDVCRAAGEASRAVRRQGPRAAGGGGGLRAGDPRHRPARARSRRRRRSSRRSAPDGAMIIKALAGGGGRGTRVVTGGRRDRADVRALPLRGRAPRSAATSSTSRNWSPRARHIEVQILGDRDRRHRRIWASASAACSGASRSSSRSRRRPASTMACAAQIIDAAVRLAKSVGYSNLGTFEFLVDVSGREGAQPFAFIEANARLQVEHTVTEAVTGVDLVQAQIRLAQGATLKELGLDREARCRAARLRDPGARQHGDDCAGRHGAARRRHADGLRGAERAGRAHRRLRLRRLPHLERLRFAAGEGDRPFAVAGFRRRRGADRRAR